MVTMEQVSVAGIHVPAFVERSTTKARRFTRTRVAGIHVPAFVERTTSRRAPTSWPPVSPGFTSRPSLSADPTAPATGVTCRCRRDSRPGLR